MSVCEHVTVAFYRRVSTDEQGEDFSLEAQRHRLASFAKKNAPSIRQSRLWTPLESSEVSSDKRRSAAPAR